MSLPVPNQSYPIVANYIASEAATSKSSSGGSFVTQILGQIMEKVLPEAPSKQQRSVIQLRNLTAHDPTSAESIAWFVVGGIVLIAGISFAVYYCCCRKKSEGEDGQVSSSEKGYQSDYGAGDY